MKTEIYKNGSKKSHFSEPMSEEILIQIMEWVRWAPSGDNCQPFKFKWTGEVLEIHRVAERDKHAFNTGNFATYLALGCTLEYLRIASLSKGFKTSIEYVGASSLDSGLLAQVKFSSGSASNGNALKQLKLRSTDRRDFQGGELKDLRNSISDVDPSVKTSVVASSNAELAEMVSQTELMLFRWKQATIDLLAWLRLSESEVRESSDGLPWNNLGVKKADTFGLRLMRKFPWLINVFRPVICRQFKIDTKRQLASSAGVIAFSTADLSVEGLAKLGIEACKVWLRLNANGYGVHPLSQSSLLISSSQHADFSPTCPTQCKATLDKAWISLRAIFGLPENTSLVWAFRVGRSSALPKSMRTKRRKIAELVSF